MERIGEPYRQREWGVRVALDFFLGGTGSALAAFYLLNLAAFGGSPDLGVYVSASSLVFVLGGLSLLASELGRPANFWRSMTKLRRSWMARGSASNLALVISLLLLLGSFEAPTKPPLSSAVYAVVVIFSLMVAVYPGMLLHSVRDVKSWRSVVQPFLTFLQAVSTGIGTLVLLTVVLGGPLTIAVAEALVASVLCALLSMSYLLSLKGSRHSSARAAYSELKSLGGVPLNLLLALAYMLPILCFGAVLPLPGWSGSSVLAAAGAALTLAASVGYRLRLLGSGFHEPMTVLRQSQ